MVLRIAARNAHALVFAVGHDGIPCSAHIEDERPVAVQWRTEGPRVLPIPIAEAVSVVLADDGTGRLAAAVVDARPVLHLLTSEDDGASWVEVYNTAKASASSAPRLLYRDSGIVAVWVQASHAHTLRLVRLALRKGVGTVTEMAYGTGTGGVVLHADKEGHVHLLWHVASDLCYTLVPPPPPSTD